jgi:hypothetical protein
MSEKVSKTESLMKDADNLAIQKSTVFSSQDISGADIKSPYFYTTGVTGITVPVNALDIVLNSSQLMRISSRQDFASYDEIRANVRQTLPCSDVDVIYIRGATVGGTINFRWQGL